LNALVVVPWALNPPAGRQHAVQLREDCILVWDEVDDAVRDHDVEARVREGKLLGLALDELDVLGAHLGGPAPRLVEHLVRHVDANDLPSGGDHLSRDERVRPRTAAQVELRAHRAPAGRSRTDWRRLRTIRPEVGDADELLGILEIFGPSAARREHEIFLRLGRDPRVGLLDLVLERCDVDVDFDSDLVTLQLL
jgi:hypothetical protein